MDELLVGILKQILLKTSGPQGEVRRLPNDVKSKDKDRKGSFKRQSISLRKCIDSADWVQRQFLHVARANVVL